MDRATGLMNKEHFLDSVFEGRGLQMGMYERIVWDGWKEEATTRYDRIGVDVPVWLYPPPEVQPGDEKDEREQLRPDYRIDAVGGNDGFVDIIEVKEVGNLTAIGQLLVYELLFRRSYWGFKGVRKVLLAAWIPDPIAFACKHLGIEAEEAGPGVLGAIKAKREASRADPDRPVSEVPGGGGVNTLDR